MLTFLTENLATILISLVMLGLIALAIRKMRRDKKKGASCGCGCDQCPSADMCHKP
ncbi:MAG: FeoB-associated Cys-rich membrane protein [Clostridiales bacterium]|nr:FeoB-associated Cys-rich membrane protein [Clostridiales bacterium]